ncbi:hypothetical protein D3C72_846040 [compost metagenome]
MKYLYWVFAAIVVAGGIYMTVLVSDTPQSVSKIKFTQVAAPEDLGKALYETLKEEIKASPIVLLGVTPNQIEDIEMWKGFLEANQEPGSKYDMIVVEPMLPYVELVNSNMRIDIKAEMVRFVEGVKNARAEGLRVAVLVPSIYSSQLLANNPADRLKNEFKLDFTSFSVTKFPVTEEQEKVFEPLCDTKNRDGAGALGCMIREVAVKTRRHKFEPNKYSGLVEQITPRDYLVLLNKN